MSISEFYIENGIDPNDHNAFEAFLEGNEWEAQRLEDFDDDDEDETDSSDSTGVELFVYGVRSDVDVEKLKEEFSSCGKVLEAENTGKGYAFITMATQLETQVVQRAYGVNGANFNGAQLLGENVRVEVSKRNKKGECNKGGASGPRAGNCRNGLYCSFKPKEEGTNYFKNNEFERASATYQKVVDAMEAKPTSLKSPSNEEASILFVDLEEFQLVGWMGDKLLGEPLEGITGPHGDPRAKRAWQGLKIERCSKISDCARKISSGRYKAIVIVDLSHDQELFEQKLGGVLQSFVQVGGAVAFPTSEGLQLAGTLRRLFNTTWEPSNYYRSMWDVSRENSDTVTEFFGDVSQMQNLPFSAKVASVKNVPQHEQLFRTIPDGKTQSIVFFMGGRDVGPDDVCVAVHKYGSGSVAFFGDVNCETVTVQLVAAYVRVHSSVDGQSN